MAPNPLLPPLQSAPASPAPSAHAILDPMRLRAATSTADMPDGVGSVVAAVVAPKEGPIDVPAGTPVVLIAKRLRDSPTFKKAFRAVSLAWGVFWTYVAANVLIAGGPFKMTEAEGLALLKDAAYPALLTIAGVYGITLKVKDNDPVVDGKLRTGTSG